MRTNVGESLTQYDITYYPCQLWNITKNGSNVKLKNVNSGLMLDVENSSTQDGAKAVQNTSNSNNSQLWQLVETNNGFYHVVNKNSSKYLEVFNNLNTNGASVGQWGGTGYSCQEWKLVKEGTK